MKSDLIAVARQRDPEVFNDGQPGSLRMSRAGQLFTADWPVELAMAGHVYSLSPIAAAIAGLDEVTPQVTGGGAGTVIDSDQPEIIVGVDAGYFLIPMELMAAVKVDLDADAEIGAILAFTDRTQAPPTSVTGTVLAPSNCLDDGPAFPGRSFHTITADITDPVLSDLLVYDVIRAADAGVVASEQVIQLHVDWKAKVPMFIKGPCSIVVCWGGTAAVQALARLTFACIPERRIIAA